MNKFSNFHKLTLLVVASSLFMTGFILSCQSTPLNESSGSNIDELNPAGESTRRSPHPVVDEVGSDAIVSPPQESDATKKKAIKLP